jgi:hypothetical protein
MAKTQITTETTNTEPTAKAGNITRRLNPNKSQGEPRGHRRIYSSICKTIQTSLRWSLTILGNKNLILIFHSGGGGWMEKVCIFGET